MNEAAQGPTAPMMLQATTPPLQLPEGTPVLGLLKAGRCTEKSLSEGAEIAEARRADDVYSRPAPIAEAKCYASLEKKDTVPVTAWSPGDDIGATLRMYPLKLGQGAAEYHSEWLLHRDGVRVERVWDRNVAYLDILRFSAGAKIPFDAWKLGDALERCYAAHLAIAPGRNTSSTPVFNYIHHLEVVREHRNKGIGRNLLNAVVRRLREDHQEPWIWLCANAHLGLDQNLQKWYQKSGFRGISAWTTIMYFDARFTEHHKVDPVHAPELPAVLRG